MATGFPRTQVQEGRICLSMVGDWAGRRVFASVFLQVLFWLQLDGFMLSMRALIRIQYLIYSTG